LSVNKYLYMGKYMEVKTRLIAIAALSAIGTIAAAGVAKALDLTSPTLVNPAPVYANGVTAPGGLTKIGNDVWVSDHLQGFCRLNPPTALGGALGSIDDTTCVTNAASPGQATFDANRNLVYVPDNSSKSQGVWRYTWIPSTRRLTRPVLISGTRAGTANSLIAVRTNATALDRNGNLYVGTLKSQFIFKVTNPNGTPTVTRAGQTSNGGGVVGLAIAKAVNADLSGFESSVQDLYIAEDAGLTVINNISACARPANCVAFAANASASAPGGISSDGEKVYLSDIAGTVMQYDILSELTTTLTSIPLRLPTAVLIDLGSCNEVNDDRLYVADDPTDGNGVAKGHVYWTFERPGSTTGCTSTTPTTTTTTTTTTPTTTTTTPTTTTPATVTTAPTDGGGGRGRGRGGR
jgi:hypothetical protein